MIRADHLAAWEGEAVSPDGSGGFVQPSGTGAAEVNLKGDGWGLPGRGLFPGGVGVGTASSTPYLAGLIRRGELNSGIPHAIRVAVYESLLNLNAPGGNQQVWPATAVDGNANTGYLGQVRNLYMGSLIALPSNVTISSLNLATTQGANVARALQQYGGYITITLNGSGGDAFLEVENPNDDWSSMPAAFLNDLNIIAAQLRIVSNSNHNGGQPQNGYKIDGGDGTVGPLAPAFR